MKTRRLAAACALALACVLAGAGTGFALRAAAQTAAVQAAAPPVFHGCDLAPGVFKHSVYVDPAGAEGDGSAGAPFNRLAQAVAAAGPGDVIYLKNGQYGLVTLDRRNAGYVTLAAAPGEKPVLHTLNVRGASHWRFTGLTIVGAVAGDLGGNGWQLHGAKVQMADSDNIVFDHNTLGTALGAWPWRREVQGEAVAETLASGFGAEQASCVAMVGNHIVNVFIGIGVGGDQAGQHGKNILIKGNVIEDFAGDAIDHFASHLLIQGNTITNGHDLCDNACIRHGAIQGWNWRNKPGLVNEDVVIDGNTIVLKARPGLAFPAGEVQGVTIFDGDWNDVWVTNNVIVSPAWHALSLYGVQNARVVNNTVLCANPLRGCWIMISNKKGEAGPAAYNAVVRNNIAANIVLGQPGRPVRGVHADHNVVTPNPKGVLVRFDPGAAQYDFRLKPNSPARGAGSPDLAPAFDIEGRPRPIPVDVGAYATPTLASASAASPAVRP